jgi:hypothetical protein
MEAIMRRTALTSAVAALALAALAPAAQAKDPAERLTAFAVDMSTTPDLRFRGARSGRVDVVIDHWSSDAQRKQLRDALKEGGSERLLKTLQSIDDPAGTISTPGYLGVPLRFATQRELPGGGRRILVATDRRISFFEAVNRPRSSDFPFLLLDIRLDANGKGTGKLLPVARVEVGADDMIEVENYASEPIRLTEVHVEK